MRRLVVGMAVICFAILAPSWVHANDEQIAKQIVQKLQEHKQSGSLKGFSIDLQVDHGTVLLKGRVSDPQQQKLAVEVARRVEGVQQVVDDIEVVPAKKSPAGSAAGQKAGKMWSGLRGAISGVLGGKDEPSFGDQQLGELIMNRLEMEKSRGQLGDYAIDVQVDGRVVWLSGEVATPTDQQLVLDLARHVKGVDQVVNDLRVRSAGQAEHAGNMPRQHEQPQRSAAKVPAQFAGHPHLKPQADPVPAGKAAGRDDQSITDEIMQKLQAHKQAGHLRGFGVAVDVVGGEVWLNGHVSTPEQQQLVIDVARRVSGVQQVVNGLIVKSQVSTPATAMPQLVHNASLTEAEPLEPVAAYDDEQIAQQILGQLKQQKDHGQLRGFDIDLKVVSGDVWMKGHVATAEQQQLALQIASHTPGVRQVINDLNIKAGQAASPTATLAQLGTAVRSALTQTEGDPAQVSAVSAQVETPSAPSVQPNGGPMQLSPGGMPAGHPMAGQLGMHPMAGQMGMHPMAMMAHGPRPMARSASYADGAVVNAGGAPAALPGQMAGAAPAGVAGPYYDHPYMPSYAWPSYAAYPNYGALTYPKQYSPTAWPYIGPFYPYPQVPLGWRKVELEWDDGWWMLDFKSKR